MNTKQELDNAIQSCIGENAGIEIFIGLKDDSLRKANIAADLQPEVLEMFSEELTQKVLENEYRILPITTTEEGASIIYRYDLDVNHAFDIFDQVVDANLEISDFSFDEDGLINIRYMLFVISTGESSIVLYRPIPQVSLYNHKKSLFIRKSDNRFGKVDEDFLKISSGIEFFKVSGEIFCFDIEKLQKSFKVNTAIVAAATKQLEQLENINLVNNIEKIREYSSTDMTITRKIAGLITNSPVISAKIPNEKIVAFVKDNPDRMKHLKVCDAGDKICISSKESVKELINLLNDNYLTSELSSIKYDSQSKSKIS